MTQYVRISTDVKVEIDTYCPFCGEGPLNGATGVDAGPEENVYKETGGRYDPNVDPPPMVPSDGAITICSNCAGFMMYCTDENGNLDIRKASEEEVARFMSTEKGQVFEAVIEKIKKQYRHVQVHGTLIGGSHG